MSKSTRAIQALALGLAALVMCVQVASQEKQDAPPTAKAQPPAGQLSAEEMMAKWTELNQKGSEHERFKQMVGTWTTESKMWIAPGTEPMVSKGTAQFRLILDGRYIEQKYQCEALATGQPGFEGVGLEGYDRIKKKYVSVWMDNMSTGFLTSEGTADASGKVCTYYSKVDDPFTGQKDKVCRSVARVVSDDKCVFEMHDTTPDGKEFKSMEITYTRKK